MLRKRIYKRIANVANKRYSYQKPEKLGLLSNTEKDFLHKLYLEFKEKGHVISLAEVLAGWKSFKRVIHKCLMTGNCKIPFMRMMIYWEYFDEYTSRLQIQPNRELELYMNRILEIINSKDLSNVKELEEFFSGWFSMNEGKHV